MRYVCSGCSGEFNLPDEMLPATGKFKLKCPSCGMESVLDREELEKAEGAEHAPPEPPKPTPPAPPAPPAKAGESSSEAEPEIFPPGARIVLAFLKDGAWNTAVRSFFKNAGFHESLPSDIDDALEKIRLNTYHAMVFEDVESNAPVLEFLAALPGRQRRAINLILIGDGAPSLDPGVSFAMGVNSYVNRADTGRSDELLQLALDGYVEYYEPINSAAAVKVEEEE